jgi:hypothetical protein
MRAERPLVESGGGDEPPCGWPTVPDEVYIDSPALRILGLESKAADCYADTTLCLWVFLFSTEVDECVVEACRKALGSLAVTSFNHYFGEYSCYDIGLAIDDGRLSPFEGLGQYWYRKELPGGSEVQDIIYQNGPTDWTMCAAGERHRAFFFPEHSLSWQQYLTPESWAWHGYDSYDPHDHQSCVPNQCETDAVCTCDDRYDCSVGNHIGWDASNMSSIENRDMARYWIGRFVDDPNLYFLGPALHVVADAAEPHHAAGFNGNYHNLWESVISKRFKRSSTGDGYDDFLGNAAHSTKCYDLGFEGDPQGCAEHWAAEMLRYVYSFPHEDESLEERLIDLIGLLYMQSMEQYEEVVGTLDRLVTARARERCTDFLTGDVSCPDLPAWAGDDNHHAYDPAFQYPFALKHEKVEDPVTSEDKEVTSCTRVDVENLADDASGICEPTCSHYPEGGREWQECMDDCIATTSRHLLCGGYGMSHAEDVPLYSADPDDEDNFAILQGDTGNPDVARLRELQFEEVDRLVAANLAALYIVAEHFEWIDRDWDGFMDDTDDCPDTAQEWQFDEDGDGVGWRCDACHGFDDREDRDDDGIPDGCDLCPGQDPERELGEDAMKDWNTNPLNDPDGDYVGILCDNCPSRANPADPVTGRQADLDNDGIGDACDNCAAAANVDQFNCHTLHPVLVDMPGAAAGDACDAEMCIWHKRLEYETRNCRMPFLDAPDFEAWLRMSLVYTGGDSPYASTTNVTDDTWCDCGMDMDLVPDYHACSDYSLKNCRSSYQVESDESAPGWHYITQHNGESGQIYRDYEWLYGPRRSSYCPDDPDLRAETYGCSPGDDDRWYRDPDGGLSSVSEQGVAWDWFRDAGCDGESVCRARVRLYFNPIIDGTANTHTAFFYPWNDILFLDAACRRCIPGACPGEEATTGLGTIPGLVPPDVPNWPLARETLVAERLIIKYWPWDSSYEPGLYVHPDMLESSATKGLIVFGFDPFEGKIRNFYRSFYASSDDVIDVEGFSAVLEPVTTAAAPDGAPDGAPSGEGRGIWIFGGKDLQGFRNDLWYGRPVEDAATEGTTSYLWEKIVAAPGGAPDGGGSAPRRRCPSGSQGRERLLSRPCERQALRVGRRGRRRASLRSMGL